MFDKGFKKEVAYLITQRREGFRSSTALDIHPNIITDGRKSIWKILKMHFLVKLKKKRCEG
jgi:hypothetical protein